jgi:hypothetical protein
VFVPADSGGEVLEGGRPARESAGVQEMGHESGFTSFAVPSGNYEFTSKFTG